MADMSSKKRLSLTDQVGTLSQQVLSKMIHRKNPSESTVALSDGEEKSSDGSDDQDEPRMLDKLKEVSLSLFVCLLLSLSLSFFLSLSSFLSLFLLLML